MTDSYISEYQKTDPSAIAKTPHATVPNQSGKPRISISGDISLMLKDSNGFEHLMPNFSNWTKF